MLIPIRSFAPTLLSGMLMGLVGGLVASPPVTAQIRADDTLPTPSQVTRRGDRFILLGGSRAGTNLFHSFRDFSVPSGAIASFQAVDAPIRNLFARITGAAPSRIDGVIEVLQSNGDRSSANLFLLNPNGILFGPNASLHLGGSFLATTAHSIVFADGQEFRATAPSASPLLTVTAPVGLQMGDAPGAITHQAIAPQRDASGGLVRDPFGQVVSGLSVPPGHTLALIGGDLHLEGGVIFATGGQVELGSVTGSSAVGIQAQGDRWQFDYGAAQGFGTLRLSNAAFVEGSGLQGGGVHLRGGLVSLSDASEVIADTVFQPGQGVVLEAEELRIRDAIVATTTLFTGRGGDITVRTTRLRMQDGGQLSANTSAAGPGGDLRVTASESVHLDGGQVQGNGFLASGLFAQVDLDATGTGGAIRVTTPDLRLRGGAQINTDTLGSGAAGDITVQAIAIDLDGVALSRGQPITTGTCLPTCPSGLSSAPTFAGRGGTIVIHTERLRLQHGAVIQTPTPSSGDAGDLWIRATDTLEVIGVAPDGRTPSGLLTFSGGIPGTGLGDRGIGRFGATGRGGDLTLITTDLVVRDGGVIAVGSLNPAVTARGAGTLRIEADTVRLDQGAGLLAASNSGQGGDMVLQVADLVLLRRQSVLSATAGLAGTGGDGGNITLNLPDGLLVAVPPDSDITANAFEGRGGAIQITAQGLVGIAERPAIPGNGTNDIDASSQFGAPGTITLNSPDLDPNAGLADLPAAPVTTTLAQGCETDGPVATATFFNTGRGGVPTSPYDPFSPTVFLEDLRSPLAEATLPVATQPAPAPLVEAQGWARTAQGQTVLVAAGDRPRQCGLRQP